MQKGRASTDAVWDSGEYSDSRRHSVGRPDRAEADAAPRCSDRPPHLTSRVIILTSSCYNEAVICRLIGSSSDAARPQGVAIV